MVFQTMCLYFGDLALVRRASGLLSPRPYSWNGSAKRSALEQDAHMGMLTRHTHSFHSVTTREVALNFFYWPQAMKSQTPVGIVPQNCSKSTVCQCQFLLHVQQIAVTGVSSHLCVSATPHHSLVEFNDVSEGDSCWERRLLISQEKMKEGLATELSQPLLFDAAHLQPLSLGQ